MCQDTSHVLIEPANFAVRLKSQLTCSLHLHACFNTVTRLHPHSSDVIVPSKSAATVPAAQRPCFLIFLGSAATVTRPLLQSQVRSNGSVGEGWRAQRSAPTSAPPRARGCAESWHCAAMVQPNPSPPCAENASTKRIHDSDLRLVCHAMFNIKKLNHNQNAGPQHAGNSMRTRQTAAVLTVIGRYMTCFLLGYSNAISRYFLNMNYINPPIKVSKPPVAAATLCVQRSSVLDQVGSARQANSRQGRESNPFGCLEASAFIILRPSSMPC